VLFDLGHVSSPEPFKKLFNQGMITADAFTDARGVYIDIREVELRDGKPFHSRTGEPLTRSGGKMGKRYKNGLPPEEVGEEYGVDTLRLYEMYMGPLEQSTPWSMEGIRGMQRFLQRVWRNLVSQEGRARRMPSGQEEDVALRKKLHRTISKVTDDIEGLRLNTAIAALIELNNDLVKKEAVSDEMARSLILMLSPFAPHLGEELWSIWGFGDGNLSVQEWPRPQTDLMVEETVILPVQVNGKVRASVEVPAGITEDEARELILELDNVRRYLPDSRGPRRFVYVPGRIFNIVV
jgi:leucyl-tRNA synthetase